MSSYVQHPHTVRKKCHNPPPSHILQQHSLSLAERSDIDVPFIAALTFCFCFWEDLTEILLFGSQYISFGWFMPISASQIYALIFTRKFFFTFSIYTWIRLNWLLHYCIHLLYFCNCVISWKRVSSECLFLLLGRRAKWTHSCPCSTQALNTVQPPPSLLLSLKFLQQLFKYAL